MIELVLRDRIEKALKAGKLVEGIQMLNQLVDKLDDYACKLENENADFLNGFEDENAYLKEELKDLKEAEDQRQWEILRDSLWQKT